MKKILQHLLNVPRFEWQHFGAVREAQERRGTH